MKKIVVLIKKDLYYNQIMYVCIYISIILLMLMTISGLDGGKATATLNYLVYTCLASMVVVPYSFNKDDDLSTRNFISTLPITLDDMITAKLLLCFIASSLISCTALVIFNCFGENVLYKCAFIPITISMIFTSIFIFVYYNKDMHIASFTSMVPIVLFAFVAKDLEKNWNISGEVFKLRTLVILTCITYLFTVLMKKITIRLINK